MLCEQKAFQSKLLMLTDFPRRSIASSSRPRTPPTASSERLNELRTPPSKSRNYQSSGLSRDQLTLNPDVQRGYRTSSIDDDEDDDDVVDFEEEEDEFGLPSIASMRKRQNRKQPRGVPDYSGDPGGGVVGPYMNNSGAFDSGDIAEERELPNYPTSKQTQGKILRPQYKDILKGTSHESPTQRLRSSRRC